MSNREVWWRIPPDAPASGVPLANLGPGARPCTPLLGSRQTRNLAPGARPYSPVLGRQRVTWFRTWFRSWFRRWFRTGFRTWIRKRDLSPTPVSPRVVPLLRRRVCHSKPRSLETAPADLNYTRWYGLVFKAHRLVYHSTLGLRVIKKKKKNGHLSPTPVSPLVVPRWRQMASTLGCRVWGSGFGVQGSGFRV